jgi:catechol 2,3-dioxygenase-like lactoylglutathione lyase family enzyme
LRNYAIVRLSRKEDIMAHLEHVNVTVADPEKTAQWMCDVFGWKVRWSGPSKMGGRTVHVGTDTEYLAVYTLDGGKSRKAGSREALAGLNHIGVEVDDLKSAEERVIAAGYRTFYHGDFPDEAPARANFYFEDENGIEFEVAAYRR